MNRRREEAVVRIQREVRHFLGRREAALLAKELWRERLGFLCCCAAKCLVGDTAADPTSDRRLAMRRMANTSQPLATPLPREQQQQREMV